MRRLALAATCAWAVCLSSCSRRPEAPASAAAGPTTVTWMVGVRLDRPLLEELIGRFERANPDVRIRVLWVPSTQYQTKLKTLIAADQAPDIFYCGDVWVAYLLPFLADLTGYFDRDADEMDLEDVYPEILTACRWNGRYLFVPRWFNISLLYYNRTLFDRAGEPYPTKDWTWDDYLRAARKLTRPGPDGTVDTWGSQIVTGWWGEWLILVRQCGGRLFDEGLSRCMLAEPEAVAGMRFYCDKVHRHRISPAPGFGPDNGFASGKLAMEFGGHTGNWIIYNQIRGLDWDIEILPRGPRSRRGGEIAMDAIGISRTSRNKNQAWRFCKFMISKASIRRHVEAGYLSVRKSVARELLLAPGRRKNPRNAQAAYDALRYAQPIPRSPDFIEIALDVIQPEVDRMLAERVDPERTCRKAAEAANQFIETLGSERRERARAR